MYRNFGNFLLFLSLAFCFFIFFFINTFSYRKKYTRWRRFKWTTHLEPKQVNHTNNSTYYLIEIMKNYTLLTLETSYVFYIGKIWFGMEIKYYWTYYKEYLIMSKLIDLKWEKHTHTLPYTLKCVHNHPSRDGTV